MKVSATGQGGGRMSRTDVGVLLRGLLFEQR